MDQVQMVLDRVNERITQTTPATQRLLLRTTTLVLIYILAFVARLHPIIRFETMIHEFDPYFNYRATQYLIEHGPVAFHNWFDPTVWYPLGRAVGFTIYPGLMWTAALVHWILNAIGIAANVRHVCVFLSPWMASNTAIVTYFLAKEVRNEETGLIAAAFMAIVPAYISRSVAGSFDNEGVAIFAMVLTFYCFVKSVRKGSLLWSAFASLSYFYMSASWGGYVFIINLIPLYVIVMMVTGRYTNRLYIAYSSFYVMGTLLSMQIRFIGFQPVQSAEHLLALATFAAVQLHAVFQAIDNFLPPSSAQWLQQGLTTALGVGGALVGLGLQISGWELPWSPRFYAALDPSYAKEWQPIIASVSEHQPPSWATFFFDLHCQVFFLPAGLYYCFKALKSPTEPKRDALVFVIMYGLVALYLSGVMIRLLLVLAPVACILSAIAVSSVLSTHIPKLHPPEAQRSAASLNSKKKLEEAAKRKPEEDCQMTHQLRTVIVAAIAVMLFCFVFHSTWVTAEAYSSPAIVLSARQADGSRVLFDDFREAYYWIAMNTAPSARFMAWWDYGYQLSAIANRTVVVDNNAWNSTHIATVGKAFTGNETVAYDIMKRLDVDYVMVVFGGLSGYGSDDINKFLWMVRIGSSIDPTIDEAEYFTKTGEFRVDAQGSPKTLNCLMYKLCYYRFGEMKMDESLPAGFDRVRNVEIGSKNIELEHVEEAFTSKNWMVRIYQVKRPENRW